MPHLLCVKNKLCCVGKLILRGSKIIIPKNLRPEVLALAHEGHPRDSFQNKESFEIKGMVAENGQ